MKAGLFQKLPVVVQAAQWDGDVGELLVFFPTIRCRPHGSDYGLLVQTLEGEQVVWLGDWILQGVRGEFYLCRADLFAETYVEVQRRPT